MSTRENSSESESSDSETRSTSESDDESGNEEQTCGADLEADDSTFSSESEQDDLQLSKLLDDMALIYPGARINRRHAHLAVLSVILGFRIADKKVSALLQCLNLFCPTDVFGSANDFFNFFKYQSAERVLVCTRATCHGKVKLDGGQGQCGMCDQTYTEKELISERSYFNYCPLEPQIKSLLENESLCEIMDKHKKDSTLNSIVQSSQYKYLQSAGNILPKDITLQINTDGVAATKSSKLSFWPILVSVNELPLRIRSEQMILLGVWMGKQKPCMDTFLDPAILELQHLSEKGVETRRGLIKVHTLLCPVDSPARADLQKISYPGGRYACPWCFRKAKSINKGKGTTRVFKNKRLKKLRNRTNYIKFAKLRFIDAVKHHKGVKGMSPLIKIPSFDIITGFQVEYMHAFCIGVFNQYLEALLGTEHSKKKWSIRAKSEKADALMMKITPPHELSRLPEPLTAYRSMKASLKKNLFCYFLIPILKALDVHQDLINNVFLIIFSIRKYLQATLTKIEAVQAREAMFAFHRQLKTIFGESILTFNMHITCHVPDNCEMWGGLWDCSTFSYESKNGLLSKLHHGTVCQNDQIVRNYQRLKVVKDSEIATQDHIPTAVHEVYRASIGGKRETKGCIRVKNCLLMGVGKKRKLTERELQVVHEENPDSDALSDALMFKRCVIKGIVLCTKNYTRMTKRRNFVLKTEYNLILAINELLLCTFEDDSKKVYANGRKLLKNNEKLAWNTPLNLDSTMFLDSITSDNVDTFINIEDFEEKVICFDVEDKTYITSLVNNLEGD